MFGQTFDFLDLTTVGVLVLLEGALSIDNALVLSILAGRLPAGLQGKALGYGLVGAMAFRVLAVALAAYLLHWRLLELLGGTYLIYLAIHHFVRRPEQKSAAHDAPTTFWRAVIGIELADMAFAIDNILAAVALVGPSPTAGIHPKLWVIITGGMLGVILMRFAAAACARILRRFPRFDLAAYLMILVVGAKLIVEWARPELEFSSPGDWPFWVFWVSMAICLSVGLLPIAPRPGTAPSRSGPAPFPAVPPSRRPGPDRI